MALRVDVRVPACRPIPEVVDFVRQCDEAGLDGVGLLDSQLIVRDVYATMAVLARETSRIKLTASVTNPVTRHPSVLASAMATVAELAPGRVEFVLGSGYSAVRTIGVPVATSAQMRETVLTIRRLLRGEMVQFDGARSHLSFAPSFPVPVWVSATSPRMIRVAAEVADGVLLHTGMSPGILATARRYIEEGARLANRNPDDVRVAVCLRIAVATDAKTALEEGRSVFASWVLEKHRARWLKASGIPVPEYDELPAEVRAVYPDLTHPEDPVAASKATSFLSDDLIRSVSDVLGMVGPADVLFQRLRDAEKWGVNHVYLMPAATYEFPHEVVNAFKRRGKTK